VIWALAAILVAAPGDPSRAPIPPAAVDAAKAGREDSAFELAAPAAEQCRAPRDAPDHCLDLLLFAAEQAPMAEAKRGEAFGRAALRIAERLPPASPDLLRALEARARGIDEKGPDYSDRGCGGPCPRRWTEAEPLYRRALDLRVRFHAGDVAALARLRQSLARNLHGQKRGAEAEVQDRAALAALDAGLPATAPQFGRALEGMIYDLEERLRFADAEPFHRRRIAWYGEGEPDASLVQAMVALARNLVAQGRAVDAEAPYRRALDLIGQVPDARDSLPDIYMGLAGLLEEQRRFVEAEPLLRQAVALEPPGEFAGDDQRESSRRLAANLLAQDRAADAETAYRALLARMESASPGVRAYHLGLLATAIDAQGDFARSEAIYGSALTMARESDEMLIELIRGEVLRLYAIHLDRRRRYAQAEPFYREAMAFWLKVAPWHTLLAPTRAALAANLEAQGKADAAEAERNLVLAAWAARFGASHPSRIAAAFDLAKFQARRGGHWREARSALVQAGRGAMERAAAFRDFGPAAQAELRGYRPVFAAHVSANWALSASQPRAAR
jgi:tetratricopeptide (TPR) repeat protein